PDPVRVAAEPLTAQPDRATMSFATHDPGCGPQLPGGRREQAGTTAGSLVGARSRDRARAVADAAGERADRRAERAMGVAHRQRRVAPRAALRVHAARLPAHVPDARRRLPPRPALAGALHPLVRAFADA